MTQSKPETLVLLDHPDLRRSRVNHALAAALEGAPGLAVRDLRRLYPDGRIDLTAERAAVEAAKGMALPKPEGLRDAAAPWPADIGRFAQSKELACAAGGVR